LAVHGWRFTVGGSRLAVHGWQFTVGSSRLAVHCSQFPRRSRPPKQHGLIVSTGLEAALEDGSSIG